MYVAAVDSSGNLEYVGVVVGEEKDMRRLLSRLLTEFPVIHMRELSRSAEERLARRVISEEGLSFHCFRLGLARLRREIRVLTGRNVSSGRLYHHLSEVFLVYPAGGLSEEAWCRKAVHMRRRRVPV